MCGVSLVGFSLVRYENSRIFVEGSCGSYGKLRGVDGTPEIRESTGDEGGPEVSIDRRRSDEGSRRLHESPKM